MDDQIDPICLRFNARLAAYRQKAELAKQTTGQLPKSRPRKDIVIREHQVFSTIPSKLLDDEVYHAEDEFVPLAYPPSTRSMRELQQMPLKDLRLETHHHGRVLIVRLPVKALRILRNIQTVVEDSEGDVEKLLIFNFPLYLDPTSSLPRGQHIAIKEPYYTAHGEGGVIHVHHSSDILRLGSADELVSPPMKNGATKKTAEQWKVEGNEAYKRGQYQQAIECFTLGLAVLNDPTQELGRTLRRNRALMHLSLEQYDAAKADAIQSLDNTSSNIKSLYRAAMACYELEQFSECETFLRKILKCDMSNKDGQREYKRVLERLKEERLGIYNWKEMINKVKNGLSLDLASFRKRVTVKDTGDRGRGLFTREAVKAGDLLLVEKPFAAASGDEDPKENYNLMNSNTLRFHISKHVQLVRKIATKLANTSQGPKFLDLHAGSYPRTGKEGTIIDGTPVIDNFLNIAILELNCFGFPGRTLIDATSTSCEDSLGIWITASYQTIVHWRMMVVRATRDLDEGEEITFAYFDPKLGLDKIRKRTLQEFGFECNCGTCFADVQCTQESCSQRNAINAEITTILLDSNSGTSAPMVDRATSLHKKLAQTYDRVAFLNQPRCVLAQATARLAMLHVSRNATIAEKYAWEATRCLGFKRLSCAEGLISTAGHVDGTVIEACIVLQAIMAKRNSQTEVNVILKRAKEFYKMCFGEDETFSERMTGHVIYTPS
ncbi:uncharacterized protein K452DRAFT_341627 [Aplosporella prunicola CBS 121167]|uniref:SET domain-containing protein n=1 Tax=Aplosporella prunicola CBS 121167 TaxID=1176127 RepID=A0A6A6AYQ5_9PEZI|nr:uncharacterized protein K452DRAFT_341627 [Aplosporella prunicola CBS 121167]KAF2137062.1 hypothetical protein K452DRAFT_341627 [Aplosporella prunicola CBS 121167]